MDLDRDERKLDAFLQLHKSDLQVSDLRIFLPFTINLDPYLRKVLKGKSNTFLIAFDVQLSHGLTEDQQAIDDEGIIVPMKPTMPQSSMNNPNNPYNRNQQNFFQPQQQPTFARSALPLYTTNVTNNPIAMMNYFHSNPLHQALQNESANNLYGNNTNFSQFKQQIPIDVVSLANNG